VKCRGAKSFGGIESGLEIEIEIDGRVMNEVRWTNACSVNTRIAYHVFHICFCEYSEIDTAEKKMGASRTIN
jgi:hypothetical protein